MDISVRLLELLDKDQILRDEPMSKHTTFRIGGPADYLVRPRDLAQLSQVLRFVTMKSIPFYIMGNGSNLLCRDGGFRGVVIQIGPDMGEIRWEDDTIVSAGAGVMLSRLSAEVADHSLSGFEFASGIPGSLGGAVAMNAGAYGGEISQCLMKALVLSRNGDLKVLLRDEMAYAYRNSIILQKGETVIEATFAFQKGDQMTIRKKINACNQARREKQPLEYPSAGSTFKRPIGFYAGKLIQDAGLRGLSVGGAQVSEKHCGFIINKNQASAKDVCNLIEQVQNKVKQSAGVILEPEIRIIGVD